MKTGCRAAYSLFAVQDDPSVVQVKRFTRDGAHTDTDGAACHGPKAVDALPVHQIAPRTSKAAERYVMDAHCMGASAARILDGLRAAVAADAASGGGVFNSKDATLGPKWLQNALGGVKRLAAAGAAGAPQPMPVVDQKRKRKQNHLDARKRRGGSGGGNQENMPPQPS